MNSEYGSTDGKCLTISQLNSIQNEDGGKVFISQKPEIQNSHTHVPPVMNNTINNDPKQRKEQRKDTSLNEDLNNSTASFKLNGSKPERDLNFEASILNETLNPQPAVNSIDASTSTNGLLASRDANTSTSGLLAPRDASTSTSIIPDVNTTLSNLANARDLKDGNTSTSDLPMHEEDASNEPSFELSPKKSKQNKDLTNPLIMDTFSSKLPADEAFVQTFPPPSTAKLNLSLPTDTQQVSLDMNKDATFGELEEAAKVPLPIDDDDDDMLFNPNHTSTPTEEKPVPSFELFPRKAKKIPVKPKPEPKLAKRLKKGDIGGKDKDNKRKVEQQEEAKVRKYRTKQQIVAPDIGSEENVSHLKPKKRIREEEDQDEREVPTNRVSKEKKQSPGKQLQLARESIKDKLNTTAKLNAKILNTSTISNKRSKNVLDDGDISVLSEYTPPNKYAPKNIQWARKAIQDKYKSKFSALVNEKTIPTYPKVKPKQPKTVNAPVRKAKQVKGEVQAPVRKAKQVTSEVEAPKKRGRPPKQDNEEKKDVPKKRGRPPKPKVELLKPGVKRKAKPEVKPEVPAKRKPEKMEGFGSSVFFKF